ncbi:MAG TPA: class I SAM-dependent methyltransferase [Bacillota bacterium]|nr:class I SAM-dependent methyltransferase [Bacillota bacterium]
MVTARSICNHLYFFRGNDVSTVLDYGAGNLRNTIYLSRHGFKVTAVDVPEQITALKSNAAERGSWRLMDTEELTWTDKQFDLIISNFVITLLSAEERREMLFQIREKLRPQGYLLVEVHSNEHRLSGSTRPKSKTYSTPEMDNLIMPLGFRRIHKSLGRSAVALLYQKW